MLSVLVIVVILFSLTLASYQSFIKKHISLLTQAEMLTIAGQAERFYADNHSYNDFSINSNSIATDVSSNYRLEITTTTDTYIIFAYPINQQISDGVFWLNYLGEQRLYTGNSVTGNYVDW